MGPSDGRSTMRHGLAQGYVFGIVGNSDHHSAYPGSYGHGRTGLYASEVSREAIWDALRARQTNALTGDCIHLFASLDGAPQGSIVAPRQTAELEIEAVGGSFIDAIDLIRNGELAERVTPALEPSPIGDREGEIETLLVLELGWGARRTHHLWNGRLSITGGRILAVEPRLRGPEIVSPLEGGADCDDGVAIDCDEATVEFTVRAPANPNNMTPATQAIALRVRLAQNAVIEATLDGQAIRIGADRLLEGAMSGNLGPIDSPAWRFHPLPRPHRWQWRGKLPLGPLSKGENVYLRLRQANGQYAWTSPIFCRSDAP